MKMRIFTLALLTFFFVFKAKAQPCDTTALLIHKHFAIATDPNINGDITRHFALYNPQCTPKNTLLFYMVGTINHPANDQLFIKLAANYGYHVISLVYENNTSAKSACFTDNDTTCYENFHKEVIFGTPVSAAVNVDSAHSIYNRAIKLLQYLDNNYPSENWGQFFSGNTIDWTKIITAGHSQGSGHATYLGHIYPVKRVIMFSGPNEYMDNYNRIAPWFATNNVTPDSNYYAFGNTNDEVSFDHQLQVWDKIGLTNYGDTIDIDNNNCPYNSRKMLYSNSLFSGGITPNHNSTMVDNFTPKDGNGKPIYEEVWKYMLGLCGTSTSISNQTTLAKINIFPNPANEYINIEISKKLNDLSVSVLNTLGEEVLHKRLISNQKIDVTSLKKGVYLIVLSGNNFYRTEKVIIQ